MGNRRFNWTKDQQGSIPRDFGFQTLVIRLKLVAV